MRSRRSNSSSARTVGPPVAAAGPTMGFQFLQGIVEGQLRRRRICSCNLFPEGVRPAMSRASARIGSTSEGKIVQLRQPNYACWLLDRSIREIGPLKKYASRRQARQRPRAGRPTTPGSDRAALRQLCPRNDLLDGRASSARARGRADAAIRLHKERGTNRLLAKALHGVASLPRRWVIGCSQLILASGYGK
jgi:hypothetical protein